ncbi:MULTISPECIES: type I pantothenate kinase [Afifella]|uniref:type I pantothenate kinase n=1 Tax=Afifella TaxID=643217 RepID=UPI000FE3896D|nr:MULTISPECIES: type I pantothenate kinase [Afifella]MCT8268731.1 type I pantothenate kinase [Afifella sp. JA880]
MEELMDQVSPRSLSPYRYFSVEEWSKLRADTPMTLSAEEVHALKSMNDPISISEAEAIYLPLSRLLSFHVEAKDKLYAVRSKFLGAKEGKMPFIIGIAGSVAVGKSTTARILKELMARWPGHPRVSLVTTDGFLYPNAVLAKQDMMERKGFPESYDVTTLLRFLSDIKAGKREVTAPVYSHLTYDIVPGETLTVDQPDILILEGLNVLQTRDLPRDGKEVPFVSDFFNFSIYIDADDDVIRRWYIDRFMSLKGTRFTDPRSYFHRYANIKDDEARRVAEGLWERINLVNLDENIRPTRPRADLIIGKAGDHSVNEVALRKL